LVTSVANGKGAMPPRGGSNLSDDELRRAVEHLVGQ
jgi:cytochrome c5